MPATTKTAELIPAAQRPSFRVVQRCAYSNPSDLPAQLSTLVDAL
jgi:hypothetical protein